ncbi:hypothetical protein O6R08_06255 [Cutibacterium equinum]|uniref:Cobyrinic acid a,c-diamide synthase n=1 Tax=Cutibacterium equinum TaxID=3016342 RepID=A0ABY7QX72_9ACTN|nr:hypothetical protein [Cutibacterium equinum]WCC79159.1 hypothetical protein O6R08_06255 [Cutibacterium equinum]
MPRRVSLPGANELFRPTAGTPDPAQEKAATTTKAKTAKGSQASTSAGQRAGSGRVRHDEKITVYVSTEELMALETARLTLRSQGINADRGRIVRASVAMALADLEENGQDCRLARLLTTD